jgi:hypothetical protein
VYTLVQATKQEVNIGLVGSQVFQYGKFFQSFLVVVRNKESKRRSRNTDMIISKAHESPGLLETGEWAIG